MQPEEAAQPSDYPPHGYPPPGYPPPAAPRAQPATTWGTPIDEASTDQYAVPMLGVADRPASHQPAADRPLADGRPDEAEAPPAHRSPDRSLLYPSLARSVAGGLVAIAVILSGIVAINLIQRDDPDPTTSAPKARKSSSAAAAAGATKSSSAAAAGKPTAKSTAKAAPAEPGSSASAAEPAATAEPEPALTAAEVAALRIPVTVLNNSRISGLAARAREDFRAAGWTVPAIAGTTYQPKITTVYYLPGQEGSARQLMRDVPRVRRMLPRPKTLPGKGLTVVVTREYVE